MIKLSVHILTYNSERYIKDALDSVLKQKTNFPIEIIVGDDASIDSTFEILKSYSDKHSFIKLKQNKQNLGILKNFKETLDRCSGEYVFDLAGDDWIHNLNALQKMIDKLDQNPNLGFIDSGYDAFFQYRNQTKRFYNKKNLNASTYKDHVQTIGSPTLGCCFRRSALKKFVDFNFYIKKGFKIEDYPILADLTENSSFDFIHESLVTYRVHQASYSSNFHDFLDLKMFFAKKYGYSKDAILKITKNYFETKLVYSSVHFNPKEGEIAFKNLSQKRFIYYVYYLSSQYKLAHKALKALRNFRL